MNRLDKYSSDGQAELVYGDGEYHIVKPGAFVLCAVSGERIALEELRYWSVDLQEAYAGPEISLRRHQEKSGK